MWSSDKIIHFIFLCLSKVLSILHHESVGQAQNRNTNLCFHLLFFDILLLFYHKFCVFIVQAFKFCASISRALVTIASLSFLITLRSCYFGGTFTGTNLKFRYIAKSRQLFDITLSNFFVARIKLCLKRIIYA